MVGCPQCRGEGRVYGIVKPPSWSIHREVRIKNVCFICHGSGRVTIFKALDYWFKKTNIYKRYVKQDFMRR